MKSFNNLTNWLNEVRDQCYPDVMLFMVGNKSDLESEREVPRQAALQFQRDNGIKYWIETSAKSGDNIQQLFMDASKFFYTAIGDESSSQRSASMNSQGPARTRSNISADDGGQQ